MGPLLYVRSIIDQNIAMRRMTVTDHLTALLCIEEVPS
jgi:hypothetical protein